MFNEYDLGDVLRGQDKKMREEVDALDEARLMGADEEALGDYFESKYRIEPLSIREGQVTVTQEETRVATHYRAVEVRQQRLRCSDWDLECRSVIRHRPTRQPQLPYLAVANENCTRAGSLRLRAPTECCHALA